ncbi:MAG: hypothetical protein LBH35_10920 [Treponema sp.]|jgi:hypothetical protein|nr:hypothetical protein [Treponema sp.]
MKKVLVTVLLCVLAFTGLAAQSKKLGAMSLSGVTGLYVVPTGYLGWGDADLGFNAGYHMHFVDGNLEDLFQANMSFFKLFEVAATYVGQSNDNDDDLHIGAKFRLPVSNTDIALGGNLVYNNFGSSGNHFGGQIYAALSYRAEMFGMPAETTLVFGKSFYEGTKIDSNIDFGMGFDLVIFPKVLNNFLHWTTDFSNYGAIANMSPNRGSVNTGLRVDLSQLPALGKFNFLIDLYLTDAFDAHDRNFGLGAVFGMKF